MPLPGAGNMLLFRPVGLEELRLVYEADMRAFPVPLPVPLSCAAEPVFPAVTSEGEAFAWAEEWSAKSEGQGVFVTRFSVRDGDAANTDLPNVEGRVEVARAFFGNGYRGCVPDRFALRAQGAREQLVTLARTLPHGGLEVACEMTANAVAVFLNFFFWEAADFSWEGIGPAAQAELLGTLRRLWTKGSRGAVTLGALSPARLPS